MEDQFEHNGYLLQMMYLGPAMLTILQVNKAIELQRNKDEGPYFTFACRGPFISTKKNSCDGCESDFSEWLL